MKEGSQGEDTHALALLGAFDSDENEKELKLFKAATEGPNGGALQARFSSGLMTDQKMRVDMGTVLEKLIGISEVPLPLLILLKRFPDEEGRGGFGSHHEMDPSSFALYGNRAGDDWSLSSLKKFIDLSKHRLLPYKAPNSDVGANLVSRQNKIPIAHLWVSKDTPDKYPKTITNFRLAAQILHREVAFIMHNSTKEHIDEVAQWGLDMEHSPLFGLDMSHLLSSELEGIPRKK